LIALAALLLAVAPAATPTHAPPGLADAPPFAVDHVVVMDVRESACIGCGDNRRTIVRAGQWVRVESVYADRTETLYADLATGTSYLIVRDRTGVVQRLKVERYSENDVFDLRHRAPTGRRDSALGQSCEIWTISGQYYHEESCETVDGIQLWARFPSPGGGQDIFAVRAISVDRHAVRPEDVRPPRDFFRLAPWPVLAENGQAGYEVRLVSTTRGAARQQVRRRQGGLRSGQNDSDNGTHDFGASSPLSHYFYKTEADGRPLTLEVERWSASHFRRDARLVERWERLDGRPTRTVLGERCTWQEDTSFRSTDQHYECRTGEGIPLALEDHWDWDSVVDRWTARSLLRRPLSEADISPPAPAVDWATWETLRRPGQ
jgi:hypothetical protein